MLHYEKRSILDKGTSILLIVLRAGAIKTKAGLSVHFGSCCVGLALSHLQKTKLRARQNNSFSWTTYKDFFLKSFGVVGFFKTNQFKFLQHSGSQIIPLSQSAVFIMSETKFFPSRSHFNPPHFKRWSFASAPVGLPHVISERHPGACQHPAAPSWALSCHLPPPSLHEVSCTQKSIPVFSVNRRTSYQEISRYRRLPCVARLALQMAHTWRKGVKWNLEKWFSTVRFSFQRNGRHTSSMGTQKIKFV